MRHAFARWHAVLAMALWSVAGASAFDGTWRADMSTARLLSAGAPQLMRMQDGQYACSSCDPPLVVRADGTDQPAPPASHADTVSIAVLDERTVIETLKRSGKTVSIRKFTVSDDGASAVSEDSDYAATGAEVMHRQGWVRRSAGPPGSHSVSGAWVRSTPPLRDSALTVTFTLSGNALSMHTPTGTSYAAPLSGAEAPYSGDPRIDTVSVRKTGAREFEQTDRKAGRAVQTWRWSFDPTGQTGHVTWIDVATHTTMQLALRRID